MTIFMISESDYFLNHLKELMLKMFAQLTS